MNVLVSLFNSLPGAAGQGLIWGIMAIGVYITYKILDVADLTVDGSLATGGAVAALCVSMGWNPWLAVLAAVLAGMLAGLATGVLHTACGIPAILAGILTQLALYSINLRIMAIGDENATTKATLAVSVDKNDLLLSSRYVREPALNNPLLLLVLLTAAVIACWPSIRAAPPSTWAAAQLSLAWRQSSSARYCWTRCSATSPSSCSPR